MGRHGIAIIITIGGEVSVSSVHLLEAPSLADAAAAAAAAARGQ